MTWTHAGRAIGTPDFTLTGGTTDTVFILTAQTDAGREWAGEHLPDDAVMFGAGFAVEHRFVDPLVVGINDDGLTVARR